MLATFSDVVAASNLEHRAYQERVVTKTLDGFTKTGLASILINSPVGSGKTPMGLAVAKLLQEQYGIGVAWVAMRRNLLTQACDANHETGVNVEGITPISMFEKNVPTHDANGEKIELIVADEAHHSVASSMITVLDAIKPKFTLGLSGTPFRTDKVRLCFQKTIRDAGIRTLVEQGYLSQYHKYVIDEWSPKHVAERYLAEPERWGKSAFYWRTEDAAMECHRLLVEGGTGAGIILGTQPDSQREATLEQFEYGDMAALNNLYILTEGWDMPSLQTAWVRDSSRGPTTQMAGRVFRRDKNLPFKQIVQSAKTRYPVEKIVGPEQGFVWCEDNWRTVKANDSVDTVAQEAMMFLAHSDIKMPEWITQRLAVTRSRRDAHQMSPDRLGPDVRAVLGD